MRKEKRLTPEEALKLYQKEKYGKLKIYLGYAPGVGKTYTMLREGNIRKKRGEKISIGYLEPHSRKGTIEQIGNLEFLPYLELDYLGKIYYEVNIKKIIESSPDTVLIDELAHTNIQGSKNSKRYQDILEILEAGINVHTTLNIQHLESLNDIIFTITGIKVRETIPDSILNKANEVEIIDISYEGLKLRLERGEIYRTDNISQALKNFFRKGNLTALRELTLRQIAQEVDNNLSNYMNTNNIKTNWYTTERVLVSISSSPKASKVIRYGARIAQKYKCEFYILIVNQKGIFSKKYNKKDIEVLKKHKELGKNLGAEIVEVEGKNIVKEILTFSQEKRITQIVLGHSKRSRFTTFIKGSIINKIIEYSKDIEIRIVPDK